LGFGFPKLDPACSDNISAFLPGCPFHLKMQKKFDEKVDAPFVASSSISIWVEQL